MEQPNILLPFILTGAWAAAVPRPVVERLGKDFGTKPVGSGPFVFESWMHGREIVLRRFPKYWRKDQWGNRLPYVDKLVFPKISEMTAVEAEIEAGRIDSAYIRYTAYPRYKNHPLFKKNLIEGVEFYTNHIGFNLDIPGVPWRDKRVRQAVNHAIDRKALVDVVLHGMGYPAEGILPMMIRNAPQVSGYEYNPEKARQLLAEAGYPKGFSVKIICRNSPSFVAATETAAGFLSEVGIRAQIEVLESSSAQARWQDGRYEWYLGSLGGEGHPLMFLRRGFHSSFAGPGGNWTRYRNSSVDQLIDRAGAARDPKTMIRLLGAAERIVVDEAPWAPIFYTKGVMVQQPYLRGLRPVSVDMDWQASEEVWLAWEPKRR
jgi:ABC-type transport system substrate-binding protein